MRKKIVLALVWFCSSAIFLQAQVTTNTRLLKQASVDYKLASAQSYALAVKKAKEKGWPLTMRGKGGERAVLVGLDDAGLPQYIVPYSNLLAAATTRANQLWPGGRSGLNLSGSSDNVKNKLGIWDEGTVLSSHVELTGRILQRDNPSSISEHSTHTSGTLIASGVNAAAKGMAYGAKSLIAYDFNSDLSEMFNEASGLLVSNHSYGPLAGWFPNEDLGRWEFYGDVGATEDYKFGYYSSYDQVLDSLTYNAPFYLPVYASGNSRIYNGPAVGGTYYRRNASGTFISATRVAGISSNDSYDIIVGGAIAKNSIAIGAVSGISSYNQPSDVAMASFSAWGPTDDGRIKPDVVADGVNVLSSSSASNTAYASHSGTSMASPNAAGSLFLLQEYYNKLVPGNFMRAATLKGLAIHTADEAGTTTGPDYQFGWGLLNVEKAAAVLTTAVGSANAATSTSLLYEGTLNNGQSFTKQVVASGKGILSATISWTDPTGTVITTNTLNNRTKMLVNDLDIRITKGAGATLKTYMPWTLDVTSPAAAAVPGDNITDNVERIDVDSTVAGQTYTITVTHKGVLSHGTQAYSLLISGVGGAAYCTSASGGGGARIDSVSLKNLHVANSAGSKTYSDFTNYVADIEQSQTTPITVKVSTADASTNSRIVKVYIDLNHNGVFDASELLATSGVLTSASQLFTTNLTIPGGLTVGDVAVMRIIVQETSNAGDINPCGAYGRGETQDFRVRIAPASNDLTIAEVVSPVAGDCANPSAYLSVRIKNLGTVNASNIPLSATIRQGSTTVASLTATYPGIITPGASVIYTFQTPMVLAGATTYSISVTADLAADQNTANNQLVSTFVTADKGSAPVPYGEICGTTALLKIKNPDASNYFWYTSATGTTPIATGPTVNTTTIPADKTYYVGKEAKVSIGPVNKLVYSQGGYNTFNGNYVKFNNSVPIVMENTRLYIGNPGQVRFLLADLASEDLTTGSFSYYPIDSVTIDAFATNPTPTPGAVTGNPANDTGAVFLLNLPVTEVGDHILIIKCLSGLGRTDSASIFRNNNLTGTTYPTSITGIANFTGNSAHTAGAQESQYYYFFYDTHINTLACTSDRVSVTLSPTTAPVLTQVGDSLLSSASTGNQWYYNDTAITVTGNHYKPAKSGRYKVTVTDTLGCSLTSNVINYVVTAIADVLAEEIKLTVSPNPNNGNFNLSFEVKTKADLSIDIMNSAGRKVFSSVTPGFSGKYSRQISIDNVSSDMYLLRIQHDKKVYVKKIVVQH